MRTQLIKSTLFFQQLLSSRFRTLKERVVKTIMLLSLCHLFSLYNPNQVSDALFIPKASLYRHLNEVSLYQWQHLFVHIGCSIALQEIRDAELKSAATRSRKCITISVDDTHNARDIKKVSYCYNWWSTKAKQPSERTKYIRHHYQDWKNQYSAEYVFCQQTRERQYG